jgi:histidine triad (HIT) family protein
MQPSIFTHIVNGEIPSHKVYEDENTLAFLNIFPSVPGHTLVIPKIQVANVQDLADDDYAALMTSVKKVMQRMATVFGPDYRICLKVIGFDVPHAHVHVLACRNVDDFRKEENKTNPPTQEELAATAKKLQF